MTMDPFTDATVAAADTPLDRCDDAYVMNARAARFSGLAGQLSVYASVGRGALLIDDRARVLAANACVHFGDGLQLVDGRLFAPQAADRRRIQQFLGTLLDPERPRREFAPTLMLPRPSGLRPWLLATVERAAAARGGEGQTAILLLIIDVEAPPSLPGGLLMQVFGLTFTEAQLARQLATGKSLQEVSAQLRISAGHARQRLKMIFAKTATCRQGELIALLAKLAQPVPPTVRASMRKVGCPTPTGTD